MFKKDRIIIISLVIITIFGFLLRFYKLADYPIQLGHDEVTQLYDSISILETGKDIYGNRLPFIFRSVNDYKPPFYTYATLVPLLIFGWQDITIRVVGAFFGTLMIPAMYFFASQLSTNKKVALLASFFTAIAPFEIFYSRKSFESGAGIFALLVGFGLLISYLRNQKKRWRFFLGSIVLVLGMYTYFSHAILIPIVFLVFLFIFRVQIKKVSLALFLAVLIALPLIWFILTDKNSSNRSMAVFITQDPVVAEDIEKSIPKGDKFYVLKKDLLVAKHSLIRYLNQFDPYYLFGNGLDLTNQDPIDIGPLYFFQLPLVLFGAFYLLRKKDFAKEKVFMFAWVLVGLIPSGLTFEKHSPHRVIMVFTMLNLIAAYGAYWSINLIKRVSSGLVRVVIYGLLVVIMVWNFGYFAFLYLANYAFDKSQYLHYPYKDVAEYIWSNYGQYQQIVFDPKFGEDAPMIGTGAHYYLGYYGHFPPEKIQQEFKIGDQSKRETIFAKIKIRAVNWNEDKKLKNSLIVASPWSLTKDATKESRVVKTFYFYDGREAYFALSPK